jgi:hypothetical protein
MKFVAVSLSETTEDIGTDLHIPEGKDPDTLFSLPYWWRL